MTQGKGDSEKLSTPDESHNEEYLVVSLEYEVHSN